MTLYTPSTKLATSCYNQQRLVLKLRDSFVVLFVCSFEFSFMLFFGSIHTVSVQNEQNESTWKYTQKNYIGFFLLSLFFLLDHHRSEAAMHRQSHWNISFSSHGSGDHCSCSRGKVREVISFQCLMHRYQYFRKCDCWLFRVLILKI